jgi:hypothetical protein
MEKAPIRRLAPYLALAVSAGLTACAPRHQLQHLSNGDGTLVATVDYVKVYFGLTQDVVVSVQEKRGIASTVATFHNVQTIDVSWLGPQDLNICQMGAVIGYKTSVPLNTSTGIRTVHVHYSC